MLPLQLLGQRFGRLLVVQAVNPGKKLQWLGVCLCGGTRITRGADLKSGKVKSCGCLVVENNKGKAVHNLSDTRLHKIWIAMRQRCNNPKSSRYSYYGGRGIKVCDRWESFENFLADMRESYNSHIAEHGKRDTSIDRINNHGNYEPSNCRWATQKQQVRNSRKVKGNEQ